LWLHVSPARPARVIGDPFRQVSRHPIYHTLMVGPKRSSDRPKRRPSSAGNRRHRPSQSVFSSLSIRRRSASVLTTCGRRCSVWKAICGAAVTCASLGRCH